MSRRSIIRILVIIGVVLAVGVVVWQLRQLRTLVTGKSLNMSDTPQIAYLLWDQGAELYVYDHATHRHIRLTRTKNEVRSARWSPDGRYLAFNYAGSQIVRLDVSTGESLELTPFSNPCGAPRWSPDGTQLVCYTSAWPGQGMIYLVQADGSGMTFLTEGSAPSWSPDGTRLLYALADGDTLEADIAFAVYDLDTGTSTTLVDMGKLVNRPLWSPDESLIAYVEQKYEPVYGGHQSDTLKVWDGATGTTVAEDLQQGVPFSWSPDGTILRFADCEYDVSGVDEPRCRDDLPVVFDTAIVYNADGSFAAALRNLDGDSELCIDAGLDEGACTPFPPGYPVLIGWRPS